MADSLNLFFGILIGIVAYVLLYVGKGIQKYSIEGFKTDKDQKSKNSGIWIFGTILTALFMFVQWIPLTIFDIPANLITPLEGIGLITLLIFSYKVLKEPISKIELLGAFFVIVGTVIINLYASEPDPITLGDFNSDTFWISMAIIIGIEFVLILISKMNDYKLAGVVIGFTAGTFMAYQTLAKRVTDINELDIVFTFVVFAMAILTLAVTQIAFTKAKASQVVPSFTSASIILTAILGFLTISETIQAMQIVGIFIIVAGVIVLTAFQKPAPEDAAIQPDVKKEDETSKNMSA